MKKNVECVGAVFLGTKTNFKVLEKRCNLCTYGLFLCWVDIGTLFLYNKKMFPFLCFSIKVI